MRSVEAKRVLAIIAFTCVCLVMALVLMLYAFDRDENVPVADQLTAKFVEKYVFKEIETTEIKENIRKRNVPRESNSKSVSEKFDRRVKRSKRQLPDNPAYYVDQPEPELITRRKRLIEHLQDVRMKFEQCRNSQSDPNECAQFYREMVEVSEELDREIKLTSEIARNYDNQDYALAQENYENYGKFSQLPDMPGDAMYEFNREDKALQSVNEFSPFPKFHEELHTPSFSPWQSDEPLRNIQEFPR